MKGVHRQWFVLLGLLVAVGGAASGCDEESSPVLDGGPPPADMLDPADSGRLDGAAVVDGTPSTDGAMTAEAGATDGTLADLVVADSTFDAGVRGVCAVADAGGPGPVSCATIACPTGQYCEPTQQICVACLEDAHCTAGSGNTGLCSSSGQCTRCTKPKDCRDADLPLRCDLSGGEGTCADCLEDDHCPAGDNQTALCFQGSCLGCYASTECSAVEASATCTGL